MLAGTRILGALAALAGMVAFACHFAVPVTVGDGRSIMLSEATATYRNAGIAVHVLLLAAFGLAAALRPAIGARVLALGGFGLPWVAGTIDQLWTDGSIGVQRAFGGAVLAGLVVVAVAVVLGLREVRWSAGGILLGDGVALVVAGAVLWGMLAVNWYRVRDLANGIVLDPRFGSLLTASGSRATWIAGSVACVALVGAVVGGGWGRRVAGAVVVGLCAFEVLRRVVLDDDRLIPPGDQANPFGAVLSGEPVLGILVLPLVGIAAGAWFLTTEGEAPVAVEDDPEVVDAV